MARAYSLDLRTRVIEAIEAGLSTREAARRFAIGISTSGAWYRAWRSSGNLEPGRQGKPKVSKLDAHETFILALVETDERDITLAEIVDRLAAERGVKASLTTVHAFFAKRGITYKKRQRTRPNSSDRMFWQRGKSGSKANSISIRAA
ncbi:IS630 transposase-related protein [Mesorhizobium newzealandense]|uniref:IS630 transposase-related protein n=2 Tax=Mesorhizobium TaxID=68287 RepID=A0ABW4UD01_9HYPH